MKVICIFFGILLTIAVSKSAVPSAGATCRRVDIGVITLEDSPFGSKFIKSFWNENGQVCKPNTDCIHYNLTEVTAKSEDILDQNLNSVLLDKDYDAFVGAFSRGVVQFALKSKVPYLVSTSADLKFEKSRKDVEYADDMINIVPFYDGISSALVHFVRTKGFKRLYLLYEVDISYIEEAQLVLKKLMKLDSVTYTEQNVVFTALTVSSIHVGFIADRLINIKAEAVIFFFKPDHRWSSLYHLSSKFPDKSRSPMWICGNSQALMMTPDDQRTYLQMLAFPVITFDFSNPSLLWRLNGNERLPTVESQTAVDVLLPALAALTVKNFTKEQLADNLKQVMLPASEIAGKIGFNSFGIRDKYQVQIVDATKLKKISEWNAERGPSYEGLIGVDPNSVLKVSVVLDKPFAYVRDDSMPVGNGRFSGLVVDIFRRMVEFVKSKYNVRINYHFIPTSTYGKKQSDGDWSGAIGQVTRRTADIAIGAILKTVDRSTVVDFTTGFATDSLAMLYRPVTPQRGLFFLLQPFHYYVWLLIIASFWIGGIWIFILFKCDPTRHDVTVDKRLTLKQSLWYSLSTTFLFSQPFQPQMFSIKSFSALLMIFAFSIFVLYLSSLSAMLSVPPSQIMINNLNDLLSQSYYKYGYIEETATENLFTKSSDRTLALLQKRILAKQSTFASSYWAEKNVSDGKSVLIGSALKLAHIAGNFGSCKLRLVPIDLNVGQLAFAVQQRLPHKTVIDESLNHLRSTGQIQALIDFWFTYSNNCTTLESEYAVDDRFLKPTSFTVTDIAGPCIILAAGILISFVCLAGKLVRNCCIANKENFEINDHTEVRSKGDSYRNRQSTGDNYINSDNSIDLAEEGMRESKPRPISYHDHGNTQVAKF